MADGYISEIKLPDNKVYLLKDSEKTDEKVKQTANTEDKEFPILFKNTNNTTEETAGVKYSSNTTADATTTKPFTFNPSTGNLTVTQLKIGTKNDNMGLFPNLNNWNQIGSGSLYWYRSYINNYYGSRSHVDNWDSGKNIGTAATSSAAAVLGTVNFYNTAAAGATQTKTLLTADSTTNSNITITLPKTTGTLALKSELPTLSSISGIGTISASGTAPLTLSGSKSGTTYTLTGSVADASASASGVVNTDTQTFSGVKTFDNGIIASSGGIWVQGGSAAGSDNTRMALTKGMPDKMPYNTSKRGTFIYSNAIAFADPLNGNTNNDAGWIRHLEGTANAGTLEIAVGDDNVNEQIVVRRYDATNAVKKEIKLFDTNGDTSFPGNLTVEKSAPILRLHGTSSSSVTLALERSDGTNLKSSWRWINSSGTLTLQNNWTSGEYFNIITYSHTSGNITINKGDLTLQNNPSAAKHAATKEYVDNILAANNAMTFKGLIDGTNGSDNEGSTTRKTLPASHIIGDTYRVAKEGTYAGKYCEVGTLIICVAIEGEDTDWTSVETNEDGSVIGATPADSTDNAIAVWDGTSGRIIKSQSYVTYLNHAEVKRPDENTVIAHQDGLIIKGNSYGNAGQVLESQDGIIKYGDGGPQIQFMTAQPAAIIYSHHDNTSGMQSAFHFVGEQAVAVKADALIAKTRAIFGSQKVSNDYVLYSNGATYINGNATMTGILNLAPGGSSNEGGEIHLNAAAEANTKAGTVIDNYNSCMRIFGRQSADGSTKTGTGTALVIDPYAKTITGGYTITGALTGNATSATEFSSNATVELTGDVTGTSAGSKKNWTINTTLADSGVSANTYGANTAGTQDIAHSGTFIVPYFTVDSKGRITTAGTKTYKLPASGNSDHYPSAWCDTVAATQAKTATCTDYTLTANTWLHILIKNANTYNGKITLNVNGKGAKDVWINGTVSSSSNKTLPAGTYLVYYDGSTYQFRTDGLIPGDISGNAATASSVAWANVSNHPTKLSQFTNDSGYITDYTETDPTVPAWAKAATKPTYTASEVGAAPSSTVSCTTANVKSALGTGSDTTKYLNNKGEWTTPPNDNTHHTAYLYAGADGATKHAAVSSGTNIYLCLRENSTQRSAVQIKQGTNMTISSDANGIITFTAKDTTYSNFVKSGTGAAAGLVPSPGTTAGATKYLREDGTWQVPAYIADTHYTTHLYVNATADGATSNAATTNTTTYMHLYDNSTKRETIQFKGSGATTVTATGGVITINSTDNNTDTKVSQSSTTTANWRKVLLHHKDDTTSTATETDQTDVVYGAQYISAQPSTGTLRANAYRVTDNVTLEWNSTDDSLDFIFA